MAKQSHGRELFDLISILISGGHLGKTAEMPGTIQGNIMTMQKLGSNWPRGLRGVFFSLYYYW